MKLHRTTIYVSAVFVVLSLTASIILFVFANNDDKTAGFVINILLSIFGSSLLLMVSSIVFYLSAKAKVIGAIHYFAGMFFAESTKTINYIVDIDEKNRYIFDLNDIKRRLETNKELNQIVKNSLSIYEQFLLYYEGFNPILRKNKKNLKIHNCILNLAKIQTILYHFDNIYNVGHYSSYKLEKDVLYPNDVVLKEDLEIILKKSDKDILEEIKLMIIELNNPSKNLEGSNYSKCR